MYTAVHAVALVKAIQLLIADLVTLAVTKPTFWADGDALPEEADGRCAVRLIVIQGGRVALGVTGAVIEPLLRAATEDRVCASAVPSVPAGLSFVARSITLA